MSTALADLLVRHLDAGVIPGAVALLAAPDAEPEVVAVGDLADDAIVRTQSMTKAITSVAAWRLVRDGAISLDDRVDRWLPESADRRVLSSPTAELYGITGRSRRRGGPCADTSGPTVVTRGQRSTGSRV